MYHHGSESARTDAIAAPRAARRQLARGWKLAVLASTTVLVIAGCSSSGGGPATDTSSASTSTMSQNPGARASDNGTATGSSPGAFDMLSYIGGTAQKADPSLTPVTIGYVNQQGGPVAAPLASYGADAAVKYINNDLGGVDGHPVKLEGCYIISEVSEAQKCAQQLANDPKIKLIVMGTIFTGNASFYQTINGTKPVIGSISASPADFTAKNTYFLNGASTVAYGALMNWANSEGYKNVVIAMDNGPAGQVASSVVKRAAKAAGVNVKIATYPVGATSIVGPLVAAGAQSADALGTVGSTAECILYEKSAKQLNLSDKPTVATPLCIDPSVKKAFGDYPEWTYTISVNANDTADPQVALFLQQFKKYEGDRGNGGFAGPTFEGIITAVKMINAAGGTKATAAQIAKHLKAYKGPVYLGPQTLDCGADASAPSSCTNTSKIQTYHGNGKWITDGYFTAPRN